MKKRGEEQGGVGKSSPVMGQMEWISRLIPEPDRAGWSLQPETLGKQEGIREAIRDKVGFKGSTHLAL